MSIGAVATSGAAPWEDLFGAGNAARTRGNDSSQVYGARNFRKMDLDGSGGVSLKESGLGEKEYDALDTDKDGVISRSELNGSITLERSATNARIQLEDQKNDFAWEQKDAARLWAAKNAEVKGANGLGADLSKSGLSKVLFDPMDANQDGAVSAAELSNALEERRVSFASHLDESKGKKGEAEKETVAASGAEATDKALASGGVVVSNSGSSSNGRGRSGTNSRANNAYIFNMSLQGASLASDISIMA